MNLSFKTKFEGGQPTHFIAKIWNGLIETINYEECSDWQYTTGVKLYDLDSLFLVEATKPKLHTIREDKANRWTAGTLIHFIINNRTPNRLQFAPVIPVISTQKIEVKKITSSYDKNGKLYEGPICNWYLDRNKFFIVLIDGRQLSTALELLLLAENDGFNSIQSFYKYFDKDFTGKIIHWTNLKY